MRQIELLSPAKNLECGLAAVNHGADAVYIGAPQFSARAGAGNSIADIESLVQYAHKFRVKVLVALNTLLTDAQLPEAEKLIRQIYEAGADALIVQDMGILQLNLPPIALHASTQTDNRTLEKVRFLEKSGFSRVVLARELSLEQIASIAAGTQAELEAFVHGSLCVSYSGQCYISQAMCGRSANRGECAQFCRLPYDLLNADEKVLLKDKHLLSLKDLNLSSHLESLIAAGVSSLKIEGRLKDMEYVKNITAFYRKTLDLILDGRKYKKSSAGRITFFFEPDPAKSFNRGFTDYFLNGRRNNIIQPGTPKSLGEEIGQVEACQPKSFLLSGNTKINNGDGLCFFNKQAALEGFRVNKAEGNMIYPTEMPAISIGTILFRNHNAEFEKILQQKTAERKIGIDIYFQETASGFSLQITDEENGVRSTAGFEYEKQTAKYPEKALENVRNQLSKLGNTIYEVRSVHIQLPTPCFFPNSVLNEWRRVAIEQLDKRRNEAYQRPSKRPCEPVGFPAETLNYTGNITNRQAESFYKNHGVKSTEPGFEINQPDNATLMFCKHCVKYAYGWCPKQGNQEQAKEPLSLRNNNQWYKLTFDCKKCEMLISKP